MVIHRRPFVLLLGRKEDKKKQRERESEVIESCRQEVTRIPGENSGLAVLPPSEFPRRNREGKGLGK